jgi:hypothetical protein
MRFEAHWEPPAGDDDQLWHAALLGGAPTTQSSAMFREKFRLRLFASLTWTSPQRQMPLQTSCGWKKAQQQGQASSVAYDLP